MDRIDKLLARIPGKHRRQIFEAIECLSDPVCRSTLFAEKISISKSLFKIRVGRYRIIFHIDDQDHAIVDDIRLRNERTYKRI